METEDPNYDYIAKVFGPGGILQRKLGATYEARHGQVELAYHLHDAIEDGRHTLAEAPTGTGKSLAYCVPAAWHAHRHDKRTIVVTANIALQEQLVHKDLPFLKEVLPWNFEFALAKGIGNYLCLDRFEETDDEALLGMSFEHEAERKQWDEVTKWAHSTKTGDISELPFEPGGIRKLFTVSSEDCLGSACSKHKQCLAMSQRAAFKRVDIVVTNYHLFFADLRIKAMDPDKGILPRYDHVVFDEGHKAADIARDFFGFKVSGYAVNLVGRLLNAPAKHRKRRNLPVVDPELRERLKYEADEFFGALRMLYHGDKYKARLKRPNQIDGTRLVATLREASKVYQLAADREELTVQGREELRKAADRTAELAECIEQAQSLDGHKDCVYFLEDRNDKVALQMKPIVVAESLKKSLFDRIPTAVVSATLTTGGKSGFKHITKELGLPNPTELVADSPFDHKANCQLIMPRGIVDPGERDFARCVGDVAVQVARISGGRMLALFTSYRVMQVVHEAMIRARFPFTVLRQGDAPRTQLMRKFKEEEQSVLLGTESFWQGVDVPGPALSVLFIDRLPFATPDDPVLDAVSATDKNWFRSYSLPRSIIAMRQGVGRLIRTKTDRGVVVLCDRRLETKNYGSMFVRALPRMPITKRLDKMTEFFKDGEVA